jgi:hypothetical protein
MRNRKKVLSAILNTGSSFMTYSAGPAWGNADADFSGDNKQSSKHGGRLRGAE